MPKLKSNTVCNSVAYPSNFIGVLRSWHVITCEYPPQTGGVSDYTNLLAAALAERGDQVHVWCPADPGAQPAAVTGVVIHRELGKFKPKDLRRAGQRLDEFPGPRRLLVQWVPQGYGYCSINLPFCWWLWRRVRQHGDELDLMVHEPFLGFRIFSLRQNIAAFIHRVMTIVLLAAAARVWVSIPAWQSRLRPYTFRKDLRFTWLPIFSNVPKVSDPHRVQQIRIQHASRERILIGHFGTYGSLITSLLEPILIGLGGTASNKAILLMGHGSERFREDLVRRQPGLTGIVHATGGLSAQELSDHITACDLLIQPYPDGVSSRRTSFMAAMSHGKPIVTTQGMLSESLWNSSAAAALAPVGDTGAFLRQIERLIAEPAERQRVGSEARKLYQEFFDISRTIATLRATGVATEHQCVS